MKKGIYTPRDIKELYTHHDTLTKPKSRRVHYAPLIFSQKVGDPKNKKHTSYIILDTPPIITADVNNGEIVLNGKHRGTSALYRNVGVSYMKVESTEDILHSLQPSTSKGLLIGAAPGEENYNLRQMAQLFNRRREFLQQTENNGIKTLEDHLSEYETHIQL